MRTTDAVVFDLGKVLIDWDPRHLLAGDRAADEVEALIAAIDIDGIQHRLDLGEPVADVHRRWRDRHPDHHGVVDEYFTRWDETVAGALEGTVAVLDDLRDRPVGLYALSNFSGELFRRVRHRFAFLDWFDGLVISGDEGVVKPDERIYRLLLARYGLRPTTALFVDDRPENIAGARRVGIDGHVFRDAATLRHELEARAVL